VTDLSDAPTAEIVPAIGRGAAYRVLARKYRPRTFAELIGQEALVRTLTNAISSGRIAHAFMLTGVRGVGKTTTARIIARALNCIGPDGSGGPTITPCGQCDPCRAIAEDRHVDILEIDAASHTGVDDVRELTDGVRYSPVSARYKVYIIDEVHMLSKAAWNALLKTLEEPPAHVKFVFATTEIRKVPVTVLSRCQRFDLRRVPSPVLVEHFTRIAGLEGVTLEGDAVALIARAADGSVRDGLSLLDQGIALGGATVTAEQVRDMLGLADRARVIELFEAAMTARPKDALDTMADLHRSGADPLVVLQDLLDFTHFLTRFKVVPETAEDPATPEAERVRGGELAKKLSMPVLTRAWQILLKGIGEVQQAPVPQHAAEMVIVRLAYAADLPPPGDLVKKLQEQMQGGGSAPGGGVGGGGGGGPRAQGWTPRVTQGNAALASRPMAAATSPEAATLADPKDFRALVKLFADQREGILNGYLYSGVHLVRFEPGRLEIRPKGHVEANLAGRLGARLTEWTGRRWIVTISGAPGEPTLAEQDNAAEAAKYAEAAAHPLVQAVMRTFPGAKLAEVRDLGANSDAGVADGGADDDFNGDIPPDLMDDEGDF